MAKAVVPTHSRTECGNCGAGLTGPYCSSCGQHAHGSARSVSVLLHDAWHIVTHVDARFWQTASNLLLRPGRLTKEYFNDHRARYLPPVRVYLVLSVLFFGFGTLTSTGTHDAAATRSAPKADAGATPAATTDAGAKDDDDEDYGLSSLDTLNCSRIHSPTTWFEHLMVRTCRHSRASVKAAFLHNIPKMMFVFVPLAAVAMLLLYWRPRRYYVEHVVFFLHNHAAMFLILLLETVLGAIAKWRGWNGLVNWFIAFTCLYMVWYVYRAMRVFYGQGRWLTITKLFVVGFTYCMALLLTMLTTLIISASSARTLGDDRHANDSKDSPHRRWYRSDTDVRNGGRGGFLDRYP